MKFNLCLRTRKSEASNCLADLVPHQWSVSPSDYIYIYIYIYIIYKIFALLELRFQASYFELVRRGWALIHSPVGFPIIVWGGWQPSIVRNLDSHWHLTIIPVNKGYNVWKPNVLTTDWTLKSAGLFFFSLSLCTSWSEQQSLSRLWPSLGYIARKEKYLHMFLSWEFKGHNREFYRTEDWLTVGQHVFWHLSPCFNTDRTPLRVWFHADSFFWIIHSTRFVCSPEVDIK